MSQWVLWFGRVCQKILPKAPCMRDTNIVTGSAVDLVEAVTVPPSTVVVQTN